MISRWRGYNKDDARYRRIPERVLNAISAQQEASEKLVGWVQMAVVIFFGLLYAVSPKTFARDMTFEPVPWFLGIWLVVTLIRLYLAYRYRMSAPLLYLSIIIDMSLLLGMIWSFHLQYQQPPSFYLKSPTLLLVKAVTEGAAAQDLSRFFSPEIARQITTAEQEITIGRGQARDAAILMVDIRGFTRLSARAINRRRL